MHQVTLLENESCLRISDLHGHTSIQKFSSKTAFLRSLFGRETPSLLEDLINVAVAVYVADRAIPRLRPEGESGSLLWQRSLCIDIPVRNPERWNRQDIRDLLCDALGFLTEDIWEFRFRSYTNRKAERPFQQLLFQPTPPIRISLFSGGLDSLAGLALALQEEGTVLAVTCATNTRLLQKQRHFLKIIRARYSNHLTPIIFPVHLVQDKKAYNLNERNQRARGFLFCILGSAAALMAGVNELEIHENGIGAINLPLSNAQLGSQNSRATHPVALRKIERFLTALLEADFSLKLPHLYSTKAKICRELRHSRLADLAVQSISCDSFPFRSSGPEQCGICTSCILRRQALWTAGFREDLQEGRYRHDIFATAQDHNESKLHSGLLRGGTCSAKLRESMRL